MMPAGALVTVPDPLPVFATVRAKVGVGENVAVTAVVEVPIVIAHVPVPEQPPPLQPVNWEAGEDGLAVRVTELPLLKLAEQMLPQLMPAGELVTEPEPVPASVTLTANCAGTKFAVTDWAALIVTVQVPAPVQPAPLQPANTEAAEVGLALRVTLVFCRYVAEQVAPQLIPTGELVTVPEPLPVLPTVRAKVGVGEKVAVTLVADVPIVTVQVPVPVHPPPLQPENREADDAGVAVRVTVLPLLKFAEQVPAQLIPAGELETEPEPVPAKVTETGNVAGMKLAVTDVIAVIVTVQVVAVPEHPPPLQPAKTDAADVGDSVRVTIVFWKYVSEQVAPQLIAPEDAVTVPEPLPAFDTVRVNVGVAVKLAVVLTAVLPTVNVQVLVTVAEQAPVQLPNCVAPDVGVASSETEVPLSKAAEQVELAAQLIPAGLLATVPPEPVVTVTRKEAGTKFALTVVSAPSVTTQVREVPEHPPPLHPANEPARLPDDGVAVSVTAVPCT